MHGLQTIKRHNAQAALAFAAGQGESHLLHAPQDENFNFNIPWHFDPEYRVLHAHCHGNTKVFDLQKLKRHVTALYGPGFSVKEHRYETN